MLGKIDTWAALGRIDTFFRVWFLKKYIECRFHVNFFNGTEEGVKKRNKGIVPSRKFPVTMLGPLFPVLLEKKPWGTLTALVTRYCISVLSCPTNP